VLSLTRLLSRFRLNGAPDNGQPQRIGGVAAPIVLTITAVALGYAVWKAGGSATEPQIRAGMKCWHCGRTERRPLREGEFIPGTCSRCGRNTFVPAYSCPNCGNLVVLNEYRDGKPPTRCERCGREVRHGD